MMRAGEAIAPSRTAPDTETEVTTNRVNSAGLGERALARIPSTHWPSTFKDDARQRGCNSSSTAPETEIEVTTNRVNSTGLGKRAIAVGTATATDHSETATRCRLHSMPRR